MQIVESTGKKIWRVVYPILLYFLISNVVAIAATLLFAIIYINSMTSVGADFDQVVKGLTDGSLGMFVRYTNYITAASVIISFPFIMRFIRRDAERFEAEGIYHPYEHPKWLDYLVAAAAGAAACLALNNMIVMSGLYNVSTQYEQVAEALYQGNLVVEILIIGIIVPAFEELLFRELVQQRIRAYWGVPASIFVTAALFGIFHMNLPQGIYAFCLGLLLSFAREKYHTVLAPILMHAAANVLSVIVSETSFNPLGVFNQTGKRFYFVTGFCCILVILGFAYMFYRMNLKEKDNTAQP